MPELEECSTNGLMRSAYKILVDKPDGKTELGRNIHTQEYNIKTDLQNKKCEGR
jgi:hypothetical protein